MRHDSCHTYIKKDMSHVSCLMSRVSCLICHTYIKKDIHQERHACVCTRVSRDGLIGIPPGMPVTDIIQNDRDRVYHYTKQYHMALYGGGTSSGSPKSHPSDSHEHVRIMSRAAIQGCNKKGG